MIHLAATDENVYRLGTQFLQGFYTVLDFDGNNIMIGSTSDNFSIIGPESLIYQEPEEDEPEENDDNKSKSD